MAISLGILTQHFQGSPYLFPQKSIDDVVTYAGKARDYTRMVAEQEWLLLKPHVFKHTIWDDLANTNGDR